MFLLPSIFANCGDFFHKGLCFLFLSTSLFNITLNWRAHMLNSLTVCLISILINVYSWLTYLWYVHQNGLSITDLHNSDRRSEKFLQKINYARFALARTDSIRSVRSSLISMPPYRRATSAPLHLIVHCLSPHERGKSIYTFASL